MSTTLEIFGQHDPATIAQMQTCMRVGSVAGGVLCADGHLGYAQPVGGVVAYESDISISGVGFDIAYGNMAVRLDTPYAAMKDSAGQILKDVSRTISFGIGRRKRRIVGGSVTYTVHNHHNYAWREQHGDRELWAVRKG